MAAFISGLLVGLSFFVVYLWFQPGNPPSNWHQKSVDIDEDELIYTDWECPDA